MVSRLHIDTLHQLIHRLSGSQVNWVLTGSMSFALQDVPVKSHDIDVQTDEAGAYEIERLCAEFVARPVRFSSTERIRSHFGALERVMNFFPSIQLGQKQV